MQKHFLLLLFPNKEELIVEALYPQQLKLIEYARKLMNDPVLRWRDKVKMFLHVMVKIWARGFDDGRATPDLQTFIRGKL